MENKYTENLYPLTIIADRYSGTYSGYKFIAFYLEPDLIPDAVYGGDVDNASFWGDPPEGITWGGGDTIESAITNLKNEIWKIF